MAITPRKLYSSLQAGVTLIEMLVVVGIIAMVSSVIIFNYSDFSTNVSVRNLSQEIALTVRKAQTYATSVRPIDGTDLTSKTYPGYGISFATESDPVPRDEFIPGPRQFVLFADNFFGPNDPSRGAYNYLADHQCGDLTDGNECLESFRITTADRITSICGRPSGRINPDDDCYSTAQVDISFRRPSPDAVICMTTSSMGTNCGIPYVIINIESAKGLKRAVLVWNTGQISVQ